MIPATQKMQLDAATAQLEQACELMLSVALHFETERPGTAGILGASAHTLASVLALVEEVRTA